MTKKVGVLFVCLGNICRSPTAEAVFFKRLQETHLADSVDVDSAGTSSWHIGSAPDSRTIKTGRSRGYELAHLRGRQVSESDFYQFDYILAMDSTNLKALEEMCPVDAKVELKLFLDYTSQTQYVEVPDPYYGGRQDFELVIDLAEDASAGLLSAIQNTF